MWDLSSSPGRRTHAHTDAHVCMYMYIYVLGTNARFFLLNASHFLKINIPGDSKGTHCTLEYTKTISIDYERQYAQDEMRYYQRRFRVTFNPSKRTRSTLDDTYDTLMALTVILRAREALLYYNDREKYGAMKNIRECDSARDAFHDSP